MIIHLLTAAIIGCTAADTGELPPLHTLKNKDIASVNPSFEDQTITIGLKNGTAYIYHRIDWDFEDTYNSTPDQIRKAIFGITMTFTKAEVAPQFPGGDSAWDGYIQAFCAKHRDAIGDGPPVEITVQFIVHMKGQVNDVQIPANAAHGNQDLIKLAKEAIMDAPWMPAIQNGRNVICYKKQIVRLGL